MSSLRASNHGEPGLPVVVAPLDVVEVGVHPVHVPAFIYIIIGPIFITHLYPFPFKVIWYHTDITVLKYSAALDVIL